MGKWWDGERAPRDCESTEPASIFCRIELPTVCTSPPPHFTQQTTHTLIFTQTHTDIHTITQSGYALPPPPPFAPPLSISHTHRGDFSHLSSHPNTHIHTHTHTHTHARTHTAKEDMNRKEEPVSKQEADLIDLCPARSS